MASVEQCERALHQLADRLRTADAATRSKAGLDRSLSCRLTDPDVAFAGRLRGGALTDIRRVSPDEAARARIRLRMSGDELLALVAGGSSLGRAWAAGRVTVAASPLDLLRLRAIF